MNNKPLLLAGSIALGIIALTLVFMAGRMTGNPGNFNDFNGRGEMMGNNFNGKGKMNMRDGMRGQMMNREMEFIDESSLSAEQKTQLETLRKDQQTKMQELMQTARTGSGISETELTTQIETLWKSHMAEIRPFVAQDQLDEFDAFVTEGKPQMPRMFGEKGRGMW